MSEPANIEASLLEARADSLVASHEALLESLVAMRRKHNLTQAVVAYRMGISQPTVAAFERYDANPTLATVRRYAMAVGARIINSVEDDCCPDDDEQLRRVVGESFQVSTQPAVQWRFAGV